MERLKKSKELNLLELEKLEKTIIQLLEKSKELTIASEFYKNQIPDIIKVYQALRNLSKSLFNKNDITINTDLRVEVCKQLDIHLNFIVAHIPINIKSQSNIYAPSVPTHGTWSNQELTKDCGLVGYTLAKEIESSCTMYFISSNEEYPNLSIMQDLNIVKLNLNNQNKIPYSKHKEFLFKNYKKMDILILYGAYIENMALLNDYRKLRPDGKVYCSLDMNIFWMNKIEWKNKSVINFMNQCDMITTSSRVIRDIINENADIVGCCRYISNGFYNFTDTEINVTSNQKENIILTVGRIGTRQKNNMELMIGFAMISDKIPSWKLKLVGNIECDFKEQIDIFFNKYPDLKERIIFTGAIIDKNELYKEYEKAKIFALTSISEGGAPNVYSEALAHGCTFITSSIDAADDIINYGELGLKYQTTNLEELSKNLLDLCTIAEKTEFFDDYIPKTTKYLEEYFSWKNNAKKIAVDLLT